MREVARCTVSSSLSRPTHDQPYTVLAVCTGNICRSPAVERLLARSLDDSVSMSSAGTHAMVGHAISAPMIPLIQAQDGSTDGFVARQLTEDIIRGADLVLALTREHRAAVVVAYPSAVRRTFTLREFSRLLSQVEPAELAGSNDAERLHKAVPLAAAQRGRKQVTPADDDVVDPYRRSEQVYAEAMAQILPAVQLITGSLGR